jgi:hypothetical protein
MVALSEAPELPLRLILVNFFNRFILQIKTSSHGNRIDDIPFRSS